MMATGYSTLFSLGLSSIHASFPRDPDATTTSSLSLGATPSTPSSAAVLPPKIHIDTQVQASSSRPQHRRRRSSVTAAQSPLGNIGVKSPAQAARASAVSPARTRHRRSESDAIQRLRSNSVGDAIRLRRGPVRTPPPDMPLPAVPAIPAEYASAVANAKKRASGPVRPPSDSAAYHRRTCLSDKDSALNSSLAGRSSLVLPTSAASSGSHWSSQFMLTPGFTSRLALAMNTPPGSAFPSPNPMQSPVDPILDNSYFEARPLITGQETNKN